MSRMIVLFLGAASLVAANPVLETMVNEFGFYADSLGWVELHAEPGDDELDLTGWQLRTSTSACTFAYTIPYGEFLVIDSASLAGGTYARGTFRLNPAGDSILLLPDSGSGRIPDGVKFPALPADAGRSPLPPVYASASVLNEPEGYTQTINWHIDSTPTDGLDNDDYSSVAGTVTWAPIRGFDYVEIAVSGPMGGSSSAVAASGQSYEARGLGAGRYAIVACGWPGGVIVSYPESVDVGYSQMRPGIDIDFDPPGLAGGPKPQALGHERTVTFAPGLHANGSAFDAMGRRVLEPKSGVYFMREAQAQAVRKIVIQR
jgi:hypothetical protein